MGFVRWMVAAFLVGLLAGGGLVHYLEHEPPAIHALSATTRDGPGNGGGGVGGGSGPSSSLAALTLDGPGNGGGGVGGGSGPSA